MSIQNKKARFNYEFLEEYKAGIVLNGCEIKSIRMGNVNMGESYCIFNNGELFIKNMHITPYENAGYENLDPIRDRKLLLTKRELNKLNQKIKEKGLTIVPVKMFIDERGFAKLNIALAKGKHTYDKKQTIKERDIDRQMKDF